MFAATQSQEFLLATILENLEKLADTFPARFIKFLKIVFDGIKQHDLMSLYGYLIYVEALNKLQKLNFSSGEFMQKANANFINLLHVLYDHSTYSAKENSELFDAFILVIYSFYNPLVANATVMNAICRGHFDIVQFIVINYDFKLDVKSALETYSKTVANTELLYKGKNDAKYQEKMAELKLIEKFIHRRSIASPFLRLSRLLSA
jgi:hypothetical protein